jgi:hypothetical protein
MNLVGYVCTSSETCVLNCNLGSFYSFLINFKKKELGIYFFEQKKYKIILKSLTKHDKHIRDPYD